MMNRTQSSFSHLPDLVHQCEEKLQRQVFHSTKDEAMKITCKQIAHSLRLVADQVDRKYCQDHQFHRNLHYLSIRLVFQSILPHYGHVHYSHISFFSANKSLF